METQKFVTVIVWATVAVVAYEAFKSVLGGTTNPLGNPGTSTAPVTQGELDAILEQDQTPYYVPADELQTQAETDAGDLWG